MAKRREMMSFRMSVLFSGILIVFLHRFGGLVRGEVGQDFSKCLDFFFERTPPKGFDAAGYQPICQRYKNQYHFASLYHRQHRVPVYSAYILRPADGKRPSSTWMYEPQLAFSRADPEMKPFRSTVDQNVIESQAVLEDYKKSNYTRGHLNPSMHQGTKENREATFTLTNIVPQRAGSNSGPWNKFENEVLKRFKNVCRGQMFVVTGALPYVSGTHWINNRVVIPEYMWSAYCCPSYNASLSASVFFPTYAAMGRNDPNSEEDIVPINVKAKRSVWGYDVRQMSVEALEGILTKRLAMPISLFHDHCQ
uniref:Uncharacterized protein n=1 Tax=Sphaeramia orbicularis TaxID=375764 RepID=A0A673AJV5_9TELE